MLDPSGEGIGWTVTLEDMRQILQVVVIQCVFWKWDIDQP